MLRPQDTGVPIEITDYDPRWLEIFASIKSEVARALGRLAVCIEHVGSTAVPGLAAKPIVDIDVLLPDREGLDEAIMKLEQVGYRFEGNLGIEGREAFTPPAHRPYHHLYICPPDSAEFRRHITFRDYLRAHPDPAQQYAELKKTLSAKFRDDRPAYASAKSAFIESILGRARFMRDSVSND